MHQWVWPAYIAVLLGALLFALFLIPILVLQYRRFGGFSFSRFLVAAAASIYAVALVSYTLLPLPDPDTLNCAASHTLLQLQPGASLDDIAQVVREQGRRAALTNPVILQVVFNVLLFIPFGVIMRRFFERSIITTTLLGFLLSVGIETTQYTGLWWIYDCAYRVADVDDVITNTTGALIGALCAPLLLAFIPRKGRLERNRLVAKPVTKRRRLLAIAIDYFVYLVVSTGLVATATITGLMVHGDEYQLSTTATWALCAVVFLTTSLLPALYGSGASWGQRAVWLRGQWQVAEGSARHRLLALTRMFVGFGGYVLLDLTSTYGSGEWAEIPGTALTVFVLISAVFVLFTPSARGLSFRLTSGKVVDARADNDAPGT
ncbi:VanZ family protein [Populibacterium corticicola]|uniref:VanZ family protein n=1 Tax=Populibacterium corticicola TaxID=1812826 RepID=A0ABW5XFA9_9MICO